ncbi:MAG TPA: hypothetical protein VJR70_08360 [Stellaceae bacterium]|nr:hypothetical protein [Stellaceae bacterium]
MRTTSIMLAAALLAGAGAAALAQTTRSETTVPSGPTAPVVAPSDSTTQNPLVNPSAAGTQGPYSGYGEISPATNRREAPLGPPRLGGSALERPPAKLAPAGAVESARDARARLRQLGYSRIARLHRAGKSGWTALARRNGREVAVRLDDAGNLVAQR